MHPHSGRTGEIKRISGTRSITWCDDKMKEPSQRHSEILWHAALAFSLGVTVLLVIFTASVWSRGEFVETISVPKYPESLPRPYIVFADQIEWIEVPAHPFRTMLSAVFSPFGLCLLAALAIATWIARGNRHARRAVTLMAMLYLHRIIVVVFLVRIFLSRWKS